MWLLPSSSGKSGWIEKSIKEKKICKVCIKFDCIGQPKGPSRASPSQVRQQKGLPSTSSARGDHAGSLSFHLLAGPHLRGEDFFSPSNFG